MNTLRSKLNESKESEKVIIMLVSDPENQVEELLSYIKGTAGKGHSFSVVVDPDNLDYKSSFYIDGDGSCRIKDIKIRALTEETKFR